MAETAPLRSATTPEGRPFAFIPPLEGSATEARRWLDASKRLDSRKATMLDGLLATIELAKGDPNALKAILDEAGRVEGGLTLFVDAMNEARLRLDAALKMEA